MSLLRQLERRAVDGRVPFGDSSIPTNGQIAVSNGVRMDENAALSVNTVLTCIQCLANDVSTLPVSTYKKSRDKAKIPVSPQPAVVEDPWPEGTRQDWLTQVMVSLLLRGNFFGRIVDRDAAGYPTMIQPTHPDSWMAWRDIRTGLRVYRYLGVPQPLDDVYHVPAMLLPGAFVGLNPLEYQRGTWALSAQMEKFAQQFFANSANPGGVIQVPGDLNQDQTLALARDWKYAHQGVGNAYLPAVLTGGAEWHQMSVTQGDAEFLASRDFQRHEIASYFGIPEHRLGFQDRTSSWGTGIEQMSIGYVVNTLGAWLSRIESYWSRPTITRPSQIVRFDLSHRLRGDTLQRAQANLIGRNGGWLNVDEIRDSEDKPPVPDGAGQDYLQPLNMGVLGDVLPAPGKQPAPPNDAGTDNGGGAPRTAPRARRFEYDDKDRIVRAIDEDDEAPDGV